ncbi:MAG: hypothetical protein MRK02_13430 [Candidatus Scalindua sp.]|nr:hypothetical protein [Candidatus Scalindua sp.]
MNWMNLGLAIAVGAFATLITHIIVRKPRKRWVCYTIVFISFSGVFFTITCLYTVRESNTQKFFSDVEVTLREMPAYKQISQYDPETYQRIQIEIQKSLEKGENKSQTIQKIRLIIAELVEKYLPYASDEALLVYMSVIIQEIEELAGKSPELCFQFLFPKQYGAIDVTRYIRPETQKADLESLAVVIRTGAENPVHIQDFSGYDALIENIITNLHEMYGDDALLLENPHAPGIDKEKFCRMMVTLYREILKLPKKDSVLILRRMLATK